MYTVALSRNGAALRTIDTDKTSAGKIFAYFKPIADGLNRSFPLDRFSVSLRDGNGASFFEESMEIFALAAHG